MTNSQYTNGKANEWAVAQALASILGVPITMDQNARQGQELFKSLSKAQQDHMSSAAALAMEHIVNMQTATLNKFTPKDVFFVPDAAGGAGDVRDVLVRANGHVWGISCKNNHEAYKHPRLSKKNNWVKRWGLSDEGCSRNYFDEVAPVFDKLLQIRKKSGGQALFEDIPNSNELFVKPVLEAFRKELIIATSSGDPAPVRGLSSYILGTHDFYKVITKANSVMILKFNFNGTLDGSKSKYPSKLIGIDQSEKSDLSVNLRLDRGYSLNFRLHTASKKVNGSLKFDVTALSLPPAEIYQHHMIID